MKALIKKWVILIFRFLRLDHVRHENMMLPPTYLRLCGKKFKQNHFFLDSAKSEANRLIHHYGLTLDSSILDFGCGVGRLPIGIIKQLGTVSHYCGIDVSKNAILWCQRYIGSSYSNFQFIFIDAKNPRYNPKGTDILSNYRLPFRENEFDIIYLYSVFSHMTTEDVQAYLKEFNRILAPLGRIFLTAFIAD